MKWMDGINGEAMDQFMVDLRSGEYTQAVGVLYNKSGGMCCLGVATRTNVEACNMTVKDDIWADRYVFVTPSGQETTALMPIVVMDYLGIPAEYRQVGSYDGSILVVCDSENQDEWEMAVSHNKDSQGRQLIDVISLNDSLSKSFSEIADRFEATFKIEGE